MKKGKVSTDGEVKVYTPFSQEWVLEMMKMTKHELIDMFRITAIDNLKKKGVIERLEAKIESKGDHDFEGLFQILTGVSQKLVISINEKKKEYNELPFDQQASTGGQDKFFYFCKLESLNSSIQGVLVSISLLLKN